MSDHLWESYDEDPAELCRRCNDWPCCCNREEEIDHTEPMPDAEVLAKASAFDPTQINREAVMRLALEMIVAHSITYIDRATFEGPVLTVDHIRRTAEQALRECGN